MRRSLALGNLKLAAPAPGAEPAALAALTKEIGARPVWLAASTHAGEDEIVLAAHKQLRSQSPDALLIVAPRHPERGASVSSLAGNAPRRSLGRPIGDAPVYVADTLGELGLLYAIAPVALVAGSLLPTLKGHNPIEPAKIGAAIVTGPYVESFQDVFDALFAIGGARRVSDAPALTTAIASLWRDASARQTQIEAARSFAAQGAEAFDATAAQLAAMIATTARMPRMRPPEFWKADVSGRDNVLDAAGAVGAGVVDLRLGGVRVGSRRRCRVTRRYRLFASAISPLAAAARRRSRAPFAPSSATPRTHCRAVMAGARRDPCASRRK